MKEDWFQVKVAAPGFNLGILIEGQEDIDILKAAFDNVLNNAKKYLEKITSLTTEGNKI